MIEITTIQQAEIPTGSAPPVPSHEALMNLVIGFLTPMFLAACSGDTCRASSAAVDAVNAHRLRNQADLLAVAQIIACNLAALSSLSRSMADDLAPPMALRLRANAAALNRSIEHNRRAIGQGRSSKTTPHQPERTQDVEPPSDCETTTTAKAAALNGAAETRPSVAVQTQRAANNPAQQAVGNRAEAAWENQLQRLQAANLAAEQAPSQAAPRNAASATTERQFHAMWAGAMADVAGQLTGGLPGLPGTELCMAGRRAAALSSTADALLAGAGMPMPHAHPS